MLFEDCPVNVQDPRQLLDKRDVNAGLLHIGAGPPLDQETQRALLHPLRPILDAPIQSGRHPAITKHRIYGAGSGG
eukprot:11156960-Lingulodinium_polyedra.AAC.1